MTSSDFNIVSLLGRGSFGSVYKVHRYIDNKVYVMKQVDLSALDATERMETVNEVKVMNRLSHRNVVKYYDSFIQKHTLYIIMEYCNRYMETAFIIMWLI